MSNKIHNAPQPAQVKATLYFGDNIPNSGETSPIDGQVLPDRKVTETLFRAFLKDHIMPHFPGFTITNGAGYWKGELETVRMVTILSQDSDAFRNQVRQFAEQYKTRFSQEAVAYEFVAAAFTLDCWPFGPVKAYHKEGKGY